MKLEIIFIRITEARGALQSELPFRFQPNVKRLVINCDSFCENQPYSPLEVLAILMGGPKKFPPFK